MFSHKINVHKISLKFFTGLPHFCIWGRNQITALPACPPLPHPTDLSLSLLMYAKERQDHITPLPDFVNKTGFVKLLKFNLHLENKNMVQHSPLRGFSCHAGIFRSRNQIFWCRTLPVSGLAAVLLFYFEMKVNYCCCLSIEEVHSQDDQNGKLLWKPYLLTWKPAERQFSYPLKLHTMARAYRQSPFISPRGRRAVAGAEPEHVCSSSSIADGLKRDLRPVSHFAACLLEKSCFVNSNSP